MAERIVWSPIQKEELHLSQEERAAYFNLILAAKEARAFPRQSDFFVRAAILTIEGHIVLGGNDEYAFSDAFVHGETAALAAALTQYGDEPIKALAFYSDQDPSPEFTGGSCGNCRDVFKEYVSPEMVVLEGNERKMTLTHFSDYLFEDFRQIDPQSINTLGYKKAANGIAIGVDVYLPQHLRNGIYGVAIVANSGNIWQGSLDTNAGYDAVTPGLAARQVWRNSHPEAELQKMVIARYDSLPSPLYRDRQALLELDEALMDHTGRKTPLPVELVHLDRMGKVVQVAQTNTREWMPAPFTAGSFGMVDAVRGSLKGLF